RFATTGRPPRARRSAARRGVERRARLPSSLAGASSSGARYRAAALSFGPDGATRRGYATREGPDALRAHVGHPRQPARPWTRAHVTPQTKRFLAGLPFRVDLWPKGGHISGGSKVILIHGSPTLNTLYWTEDRADSFCAQMAGLAGAKAGDVIAFGHTHKPWH